MTLTEFLTEAVSTGKEKNVPNKLTTDTKLDELLAILRWQNYRFEQMPTSERYRMSDLLESTAYVDFKTRDWDQVTLFFPQSYYTDAYKLCFGKKTGLLLNILRSTRMVSGRPQWEDVPNFTCLTNLNYGLESRRHEK